MTRGVLWTSSFQHRPGMSSLNYKLGYLCFFLVLWLAPLFWTGWTLRGWSVFPHWLSVEHQVSGLFLRELKSCHDFHLEWMKADGEWIEVDERKLYPAVVFADRSRFDQLVGRSARTSLQPQILFKIAHHALEHGKATKLIPADVTRMRLVRTEWRVGQPELAHPQGAWKRPNSLEVPAIQRAILAEYEIKSEMLIPVKISPEPTVLKKAAPSGSVPPTPIPSAVPPQPPPVRRLMPQSSLSSPAKELQQMPKSSAPINSLPTKTVD